MLHCTNLDTQTMICIHLSPNIQTKEWITLRHMLHLTNLDAQTFIYTHPNTNMQTKEWITQTSARKHLSAQS
jgi:hypothetical protein